MKYLIWSIEHNSWWKPNKCGYTQNIKEAGIYEENEANKIVKEANKYVYDKGVQNECLISEECII